MNKTKIIQDIASNLKGITDNLEALAEVLRASAVSEEVQIKLKEENPKKAEKTKTESITIEKVRATLAELSQGGKQAEVKALIQKYGAEKLTALDPTCYPELLKEAEEL